MGDQAEPCSTPMSMLKKGEGCSKSTKFSFLPDSLKKNAQP